MKKLLFIFGCLMVGLQNCHASDENCDTYDYVSDDDVSSDPGITYLSTDINSRKMKNDFIIHACNDNVAIIAQLLDEGYNPNTPQPNTGFTALSASVSSDNQHAVRSLLLGHPLIDINVQDVRGDTPLHTAVRCKCYQAVQELLDAGADTTITNENDETPLMTIRFTDESLQSYDTQEEVDCMHDVFKGNRNMPDWEKL